MSILRRSSTLKCCVADRNMVSVPQRSASERERFVAVRSPRNGPQNLTGAVHTQLCLGVSLLSCVQKGAWEPLAQLALFFLSCI